jgi:hypothetical protein
MVVITKAQEIDAILLSLNGDFSHIVNYPPKDYKGIVALQMHNHAEILPKLTTRLKSAFVNLLVSWPKTMKIGLGPLFPNADTINFDDEQLPAVMVHRGIHLQIRSH